MILCNMSYESLANTVMIFHAILIVFVFVGILVSIRNKRFRPIESLILLSAIIIWSLYGGCPLTYLENSLRIQAGNPLPITEIGFIPFYVSRWFAFSVTDYQLTFATYLTAIIFFATSIEWLSPFVNPELVKIRRVIKHRIFKRLG